MNAREKFSKGDIVVMSVEGDNHFKHSPELIRAGVVAFKPHPSDKVGILQNGKKGVQYFHIDFWEKA